MAQRRGIYEIIRDVDRRVIFLFIALSVIIPLLLKPNFPQFPSQLVKDTFAEIDRLEPGERVLFSFDYDPASEPEIQPMATAFLRHCFEQDLKVYITALWPIGQNMAEDTLTAVLPEFPDKVYGIDYVNLGFKPGNQGVINVLLTDIRKLYPTDVNSLAVDDIPMMKGVKSLKDISLIVNASAGYPGLKEWVQFGADPAGIRIIGGSTAVQAPLLYPYIPNQLHGQLGGLKAAAEYEELLDRKLCAKKCGADDACQTTCKDESRPKNKGMLRMGAQAIAHIVIMLFITLGNITYFVDRRKRQ